MIRSRDMVIGELQRVVMCWCCRQHSKVGWTSCMTPLTADM